LIQTNAFLLVFKMSTTLNNIKFYIDKRYELQLLYETLRIMCDDPILEHKIKIELDLHTKHLIYLRNLYTIEMVQKQYQSQRLMANNLRIINSYIDKRFKHK